MNRKPQDSTDELVQKLQKSLQQDQTNDDGAPEDVFADHSAAVKHRTSDEAIEAFDSYMAELLGEVIAEETNQAQAAEILPDQSTSEMETEREQQDVATKTQIDENIADTADEQQEENILSGPSEDIQPQSYDEEDAREERPFRSDMVSDVSDMGENDRQEKDTEQTHHMESATFEVVEQLTMEQVIDANDADGAMVDIGEIQEDMEQQPIPVEQSVSHAESEAADNITLEEKERQPTDDEAWQENDLVLDEDDEIPVPLKETSVAQDEATAQTDAIMTDEGLSTAQSSEPVPTPTPVASPLDAARELAEQKQAEQPTPRPKQSPLDAMASKTQSNVTPLGGDLSVFAGRQGRERTLTDDDVELLLDLGYDSNLIQKVGSQRVETVRYRRQNDEKARKALRHVNGCAGEEYSGHGQDMQIVKLYRKQWNGTRIRLALNVFLTMLLLLTDLFSLYRDQLPTAWASVPTSGAYGMVGIVLLGMASLSAWPFLKRGWRALFGFSPVPASIPVVLLLTTLLYDIVILFDHTNAVLLNVPTGMALVLLVVGELMALQRERVTFDVVSARSRKIVMERVAPRKKKAVRNGQIMKIIDDEAGEQRFRVHPTDQVAGYFRRSGEMTPRYRALSALLLGGILSALVVGVLTLIVTEQLIKAMTAFLLTMQIAMPTSALLSYAYPLLLATRQLTQHGCAIVGHGAVDEYAGEKTLVFDDTEMFRSKSSTEISIKGSGDTKKYIRYAKRLFRTLGGTLQGVTTSDMSEELYEEKVEILKIFDQGVQARIDGKVDVLAGSSDFMVRQGIRVPGESAELLVRRNVESCILYLAFDGKLRLGYEIDYRISGRFEQVAEQLVRCGTAVAIETCDPNIHEDFLTRSRKPGRCPVAVVKPLHFERHTESLLCDSGLVATRSARDIARAAVACDRLMENDKQLMYFQRVACVFGSVMVLGMSLFGLLTQNASVIAALIQAVWCIPVMLLSRKNLMNEQESESEHGRNQNRAKWIDTESGVSI